MSEHSVFGSNVLRHLRDLIVTFRDVRRRWQARIADCLFGYDEFTEVGHARENPLTRTETSNLASHRYDFPHIVVTKRKGVTNAVRKPFHSSSRIDSSLSSRTEGPEFGPDQEFKVAQRPVDGRHFFEANVVRRVNNDLCRHPVS